MTRAPPPGDATKAGFSTVVGCAAAKEQLRRLVVTPLRHPKVFRKLGIASVPSVLLHGPPGTGKTFLASALAEECNCPIFVRCCLLLGGLSFPCEALDEIRLTRSVPLVERVLGCQRA